MSPAPISIKSTSALVAPSILWFSRLVCIPYKHHLLARAPAESAYDETDILATT